MRGESRRGGARESLGGEGCGGSLGGKGQGGRFERDG